MAFFDLWSHKKSRADRLERENLRLKRTVQYMQGGGDLTLLGHSPSCSMAGEPLMFLGTFSGNHTMGGTC